MSREIVQKSYKPTPECVRINELAKSAMGGAELAKKQIYLAGEEALKCGQMLLLEKSKITKEMGRGYWQSYFEINHGKVFTLRTAQRWMSLAQTPAIENDTPRANVVSEEEPNRLRGVMVSLEIFPKKTNIPVEGEAPQPVRNSSFLVICNRFKAWHANWRKINGEARPSEAQLKNFRLDVRPLLEFLEVGPKEDGL